MPLSSSGDEPLSSWHFSQRSLYTATAFCSFAASNGCLARTNFCAAKNLATASASASERFAITLHMSDLVPFLGPEGMVTSAQVRVFFRKLPMLSIMYFTEYCAMIGMVGSVLTPFLPWHITHWSLAIAAPSAAEARPADRRNTRAAQAAPTMRGFIGRASSR